LSRLLVGQALPVAACAYPFKRADNTLSRGPSAPLYGVLYEDADRPVRADGLPCRSLITSPWLAERVCKALLPDARRTTWMIVDALSVSGPHNAVRC
jgi:hypothetical protein